MDNTERAKGNTGTAFLVRQLESLAEEDPRLIPLLSNASALVWEALEDINWAGFYLLEEGQLVLGPFQGRPACVHIRLDRGVCGACASSGETKRVADVHAFPGHIACDAASRSELVVPVFDEEGRMRAVLDIDSPTPDRFDEDCAAEMEQAASALGRLVRW